MARTARRGAERIVGIVESSLSLRPAWRLPLLIGG
jgi:hypothetical protein